MYDTKYVAAAGSGRGRARHSGEGPGLWAGWIIFAGAILIMMGAWQGMLGFVALLDPGYYQVTSNGLVFEIDYTTWGWIHIVLGAILAIVGIGVLAGQMWARVVAIIFTTIAALVNVTFMAAYPVWTTILVALDVITIYALVVHGKEMKEYGD